MRRTRLMPLMAVAISMPLLGGCMTDAAGRSMMPVSSNTMMGAGGGALLGGVIGAMGGGRNRGTNAVIGAALGALAGGFASSLIGQSLPPQDQQRAESATAQVLAAPVPQSTVTQAQRQRRPVQVARPPSSTWASTQAADTRGTATLVSVEPAPTDPGRQCRTVREVAYISGREVVQNTRYCETAAGGWEAAT